MSKKPSNIYKVDFYVVYPGNVVDCEERHFELTKHLKANSREELIELLEPTRKGLEFYRGGVFNDEDKKEFEVDDKNIFYYWIEGDEAKSYNKEQKIFREIRLEDGKLDKFEFKNSKEISSTKMRLEVVVLIEQVSVSNK